MEFFEFSRLFVQFANYVKMAGKFELYQFGVLANFVDIFKLNKKAGKFELYQFVVLANFVDNFSNFAKKKAGKFKMVRFKYFCFLCMNGGHHV